MKNDERFNQACDLWDKRRLKEAFRLFLAAAEDGDQASQTNVGYFYDCGIGTKKDKDAALRWYTKAHRSGDSSATLNIGTVYVERGENKRALKWFERALERGNAGAALDIGKVYLSQGNLELAAKYLERVRKSNSVSDDTIEKATDLLNQVRESRHRGRVADRRQSAE
jgi:TPR repeat protein